MRHFFISNVSHALNLILPFLSYVSFEKITPFLGLLEIKLSLNMVYVEQKEKQSGPYCFACKRRVEFLYNAKKIMQKLH